MSKSHLLQILAILLVGIVVGISRKRTWRTVGTLRPKARPIVEMEIREDYGTIVAPTG